MAPILHLICRLPLLLLLLLLGTTIAAPIDRGFTVELIHRYSERSPYYIGNLTESQLLQRLIEHAISYGQWMESANITTVRPPLFEFKYFYLLRLSIGSGAAMKTYHLHFDTGSSLTWVQCDPCSPCFPQPGQLFDPMESPTHRPLPYGNPLCAQLPRSSRDEHGNCWYDYRYDEGTSTRGLLSKETFTFESGTHGHAEVIPDLAFGCTHSTTVAPSHPVGFWDGIIGLGRLPVSIPMQLERSMGVGGGGFSYCLVKPRTNGPSGFLRFGRDSALAGPVQRTPISWERGVGQYFFQLNGISVADRRLRLPPGLFARHPGDGGRGGCVFDTGTTISHLIKPAYDEAREELVSYFSAHGVTPADRDTHGMRLDLCYSTPDNPGSVLPHMTLHFEGADYRIGWEQLFMRNNRRGAFCWAMLSSRSSTVIGAHQQFNIRFSFDVGRDVLSFVPQDCAQGSHH